MLKERCQNLASRATHYCNRSVRRCGIIVFILTGMLSFIACSGGLFIAWQNTRVRLAIEHGTISAWWREPNPSATFVGDIAFGRTPFTILLWPDWVINWPEVLIVLPLWLFVIIYSGVLVAMRIRTPKLNLCVNCKYDMRDLAEEAVCPECGTTPSRRSDVAVKTNPRWRVQFRMWTLILAGIVLLGVVIAFLMPNDPRVIRDISRYTEVRLRMEGIVGAEAIRHLPAEVPRASEVRMWAHIGSDQESSELLLKVRLPPVEFDQLVSEARQYAIADIAPEDSIVDYSQRGLAEFVPAVADGGKLPDAFEVIMLHRDIVSPGVDRISTGLLADSSAGVVVWWTRRWRVPWN